MNLYDGGEPYGSELAWQGWMVGPPADSAFPNDTIASSIGLDYYRYQAFWHNPPVSFTLRDVTFTANAYRRLQPLGRIYNATDPDLSAFRAHGGKLILYHGWADQAISPWTSLDYYSALAHRMGGYQAAQQFSRLYMIPGLYHCPCGPYGTGDPAATIDLMAALVDWVEHGTAPTAVTFPVSAQSTGTPITSLTVQPFDPLSPPPHNDGLNSNYHYIGIDSGISVRACALVQSGGTRARLHWRRWCSHEPHTHAEEADRNRTASQSAIGRPLPGLGRRTSGEHLDGAPEPGAERLL